MTSTISVRVCVIGTLKVLGARRDVCWVQCSCRGSSFALFLLLLLLGLAGFGRFLGLSGRVGYKVVLVGGVVRVARGVLRVVTAQRGRRGF